ncbi:hypothetical protein LTSEURB_5999 [Salmonella enterica subsp. enterica serovar Urbana str. R8-2977]|uniref:Uncharacterized protein n=1 Tax=Salmonella enterica subsp. enterica serovar Urbana str. R8-2977 TaxID=913084 RepID=G5S3N7_SALET|nr:hypothetical protein LTSEURB_5999 [Salmonella enterica subsp. enterica serovar Urbana str. R8-2977]
MKVLAFLYFYTLYTGVNAFYSHSYFIINLIYILCRMMVYEIYIFWILQSLLITE